MGMNTAMKDGGSLLMECLINLGAKVGFGVPGESYLAVLNAMHDHQDEFRFIVARQEGGAAYMAEAWGKLSGEPGMCFVTRGPGATNASIGVHTAMQNSTPMLLFVGQVGSDMIGREAFQEIDYTAYFGSIAKWVVEIDDAERIPELISRAWATALSGRPGPVIVSLPETLLTQNVITAPCKAVHIPEPAISMTQLATVEAMLNTADNPVVIVGGSRWEQNGVAALSAFCQANNLPIVAAHRFHDIIDNHHDCYAGDASVGMHAYMKSLLREADLIMAINIRFGEMTTDAYQLFDCPTMKAKLIHSHVSDAELGKIYAADIPLHSGPNCFAEALSTITLFPKPERLKWCETARQTYLSSFEVAAQNSPVDMGEVMKILADILPDDVIITHGAGNFALWPNRFMKFGSKARLLGPQSGAMGAGVPAAIAAKARHPERTVLCFAGDGDFQMNGNELGTAMQENIQPIILILNNGTYGTIRMHQERTYPNRVSGTDLVNPDFVALASAYGFYGERVSSTDEFRAAFDRALASPTGAILELMIGAEAISPRATISGLREGSSSS